MSNVAVFILVVGLALLIALLFALMFSYYYLLKRIATKFPKYYTQLGSPFLPSASRQAIAKTIRHDNYNYALMKALLINEPKNFPKDVQLARLATQVRIEILSLLGIVCFGIGFIAITRL